MREKRINFRFSKFKFFIRDSQLMMSTNFCGSDDSNNEGKPYKKPRHGHEKKEEMLSASEKGFKTAITHLSEADQKFLLILFQSKQKYEGKYKSVRETTGTCCLLATGPQQDQRKRYRPVGLGQRHQKLNAHVVAFLLANLMAQIPADMQVSHLCHNPQCWDPAHLLLESSVNNLARNICVGHKWITCPCSCNFTFNPCPHNPQCILPH